MCRGEREDCLLPCGRARVVSFRMANDPESRPSEGGRPPLSILDKLTAGLATRQDIAQAIMDEVHAGLQVYCSIPEGYAHCELGDRTLDFDTLGDAELRNLLDHPPGVIINPARPHLEAMELFRMILEGDSLVCEGGDPLRPTVGAYLYGPPGVGKTHVMAAFGRAIQALLASRLDDVTKRIRSYIDIFHRQYQIDFQRDKTGGRQVWTVTADSIKASKTPEQKFQEGMENIRRSLAGNKDQPTDMLYLGFDDLCELYVSSATRRDALVAIENAPVVFVDDLHGKGDPERLKVIQRLIERRYELGQFGTFLTTNVDVEHIGGGDESIGKRILSRSRESFVPFDFTGCTDWREAVKNRKIKLIQAEIGRRIAARTPTAASAG